MLLAYCTLHPASDTDACVGLKISIKSLVNVAPEFPPPPYTCEITSEEPGAAIAVSDVDSNAEKNTRKAANGLNEKRLKVMAKILSRNSRRAFDIPVNFLLIDQYLHCRSIQI